MAASSRGCPRGVLGNAPILPAQSVTEPQRPPSMRSPPAACGLPALLVVPLCRATFTQPPKSCGTRSGMPGSGRSSGGEPGNPLEYSCLENPMDRGAWRAPVHGVAKSRTQLAEIKPPSLASPGMSRPILYHCATWDIIGVRQWADSGYFVERGKGLLCDSCYYW